VAMDGKGTVYVADRFNYCIRKIAQGQVTTLAGKKGNHLRDGLGAEAGFYILGGGMALDDRTGDFYVSDGNAVRRVDPRGQVTTVVGDPTQRGFDPWRDGKSLPGGLNRFAQVPCLCCVGGLALSRGQLFMADQSNHAIRVWDLATGDLSTLVGHPSRDGFVQGRLPQAHNLGLGPIGALKHPSVIALDDQGRCLVGMDTCIAELSLDRRDRLTDPRLIPSLDEAKRETSASARDSSDSKAGQPVAAVSSRSSVPATSTIGSQAQGQPGPDAPKAPASDLD